MARWEISSWLAIIRSLQILGILTSAVVNGFLLVYINSKKLGLSDAMYTLEILTCVMLIYTAIVLLVQHTGRRRLRQGDAIITTFIIGDILFAGLAIGIITIMARTGVPSNCAGMTRTDFGDNDAPEKPSDGYDTIRFGSGDKRGMLDHYCGLERSYYFITIAILFSYMATVTMGVLRIYERIYNRQLDDASKELMRLESKSPKTQTSSFTQALPHPSSPLQQGVSTSSPRSFQSRYSFRDQPGPQQHRPTMPVSPITASPTITIDPAREGLLIDQPPARSLESVADAAMVTDGYRDPGTSGMPALPPYTPGESSRFMTGHGHESNDMRLSEYVKGQTAAQDMKDGVAV